MAVTATKRKRDDLEQLCARQQKALALGKKWYARADALMDEIEHQMSPGERAGKFDGDLKRQPLEHDIVHCIPWDFEHDGGHYTKLSCEGLGEVFVKQVLFSGEMK